MAAQAATKEQSDILAEMTRLRRSARNKTDTYRYESSGDGKTMRAVKLTDDEYRAAQAANERRVVDPPSTSHSRAD